MRFITIKELHERTSEILRAGHPAVVTVKGKPRAVVQPISEEDLEEPWFLSPRIRSRIEKGLKDLAEGKTLTHDQVKRRLFG